MNVTLHIKDVHIHMDNPTGIQRQLTEILKGIRILMADVEDIQAKLAEANETTNEIAADLQELLDKINTGMSAEAVAAVKAGLSAHVEALKGVAAVVPEAEPPPTL